MNLAEYYEVFRKTLGVEFDRSFPRDVASCIAAGHYAGMSIEQLHKFMARRAEISSVSVALINQNTSVGDMEKIIEARACGCVYPAEILRHAFKPEEVTQPLRDEVFNKNA